MPVRCTSYESAVTCERQKGQLAVEPGVWGAVEQKTGLASRPDHKLRIGNILRNATHRRRLLWFAD